MSHSTMECTHVVPSYVIEIHIRVRLEERLQLQGLVTTVACITQAKHLLGILHTQPVCFQKKSGSN